MLDDARELAEQTGLLALNAAIESSRSGESGRQLAVIATQLLSYSKCLSSSPSLRQQAARQDGTASILAQIDTYALALRRDLGKISSLSGDLDALVQASMKALLALESAANIRACDQRQARDLIRLAVACETTKKAIDRSIALDHAAITTKIAALRQTREGSRHDEQSDTVAGSHTKVDRNDIEMF